MRDIGEGYGVAAGDAFVSKLLDEIAEEDVDGIGGREVFDVPEELVGGGFVLELPRLSLFTNMMGAECGIGIAGEHAAAVASAVDVLARGKSRRFRNDGDPGGGGFCVVI